MRNLKDFISIEICKLDSKVPSAIYVHATTQAICLEEDFRESISFSHTYILENILDLKQFKIKTV